MSNVLPLKIAFLNANDARNPRIYSGTYFHMGEALMRNGFDVTFIGPLKQWEERIKSGRDEVQKVTQSFLKRKTDYLFTYFIAKQYAKRAKEKLKGKEFDFIFAPNAYREIAFLKTDIPIIYTNDCTWNQIVNYYSKFSNITNLAIKLVDIVERRAIRNAALLPYPTQWVIDSATKYYGGDASKMSIVPWGANMSNNPAREKVLMKERSPNCRLFFLGVNWERKGGKVAFETLLELEKLGVKANLVVCGCEVPKEFTHPRIEVIRFLSKKDEPQRKRLEELFLTSDFFLLPTRAECYGIVYSEAAAYGLPVITTDTGGVSGVVKEGVNGHLLPLEARGDQYAKLIKEIYSDKIRYELLVHSSRNRFEKYLNWDVWAKTLGEQLHSYKASHPKS